MSEKQLRRAFDRSAHGRGRPGDTLLTDLETRLDALVLRAGLARTIYQARQFVSHGHILVNGGRVDIPSYRVRPGAVISVTARSRTKPPFLEAARGRTRAGAASPATCGPTTPRSPRGFCACPTRGDPGHLRRATRRGYSLPLAAQDVGDRGTEVLEQAGELVVQFDPHLGDPGVAEAREPGARLVDREPCPAPASS